MTAMLNGSREATNKRVKLAAENAAQQGKSWQESTGIGEENVRRSMDRANNRNGDGGLFTVLNRASEQRPFLSVVGNAYRV